MKKVFVLGSINMDLVIHTPYIPSQGETLTGSDFFSNGGGKGANQAVACAKQDVETYLIGGIGKDNFGKVSLNTLNNYNVKTNYIKEYDCSTGVAVILICDKDNRIILDCGANHKITKEQIDEGLKDATPGDIFITQLENNLDAVKYGLKKAHELKLTTIFNPAPAIKLDLDIFQYVDYLVVNEGECELLSDIKYENKESLKKVINKLKVHSLIVTLGSKGSVYMDENDYFEIKAHKIDPIDTTAAGDTYVGVFASQLANNILVLDALNYASLASSLTCLKKGAQQAIPTKKETLEYKK